MAEPYAAAADSEKAQQDGQDSEGEARPSSEARTSHEDSHRLSTSSRDSFDREQAATLARQGDVEEPQLSPKLVDKTEAAPLKSRKGTPRNTDSFLKDDSIETRKITLTPGLLREDGSTKSASSESARNTSLESLVKTTSPPEQVAKKDGKKEKEKKEKKQGMLSGLFKSKKKDKDKKARDEVPEGDAEKPSNEYSHDSPRASPAPSGRSSPTQQSSGPTQVTPGLTIDTRRQEVQTRQPSQRSKLTKAQPNVAVSPSRSPAREDKPVQQQPAVQEEPKPQSQAQPQEQKSEFVAELEGSEAAFEMAAADDVATQTIQTSAPAPKEGPLSPLTNMLKSSGDKPTKAKRSKQRVELDDFDSPADDESPNPFKEQEERARKAGGAEEGGVTAKSGELDDSPVEISHNAFMHGTDSIHIPMPGQFEPDEGEEESDDDGDGEEGRGKKSLGVEREKEDSLTSSPSLVEAPSSSSNDTETDEGEADESSSPPPLAKSATSTSGSGGSGSGSLDSDATPTGPRSPSQPLDTTTASSTSPARGLSIDENSSTTSPDLTPNTDTKTPSSSSASASQPSSEIEDEQEQEHGQEQEQHQWSDASLRAWLEDGSDVRDMMVLIRDTSGVVPVKADHPAMRGLWVEERKGVGRMMGELDGLLEGFLRGRGVRLT